MIPKLLLEKAIANGQGFIKGKFGFTDQEMGKVPQNPCTYLRKAVYVVYFDQQMHACTCVGMVENNEKCFKIIKNILFSSCLQEAHVRLTYENETCPKLVQHRFCQVR